MVVRMLAMLASLPCEYGDDVDTCTDVPFVDDKLWLQLLAATAAVAELVLCGFAGCSLPT